VLRRRPQFPPPFWSQLLQIIQRDGCGWKMENRGGDGGAPKQRQRQVMAQVAIYQLKFCLTTRMPRKRTQTRSPAQIKKKEKKTRRSHKCWRVFLAPPLFLTNWGDIATCSTPLRKIHHPARIVFQCNLATFNVSWRVFISLPTNRSICQQVEC